MLSLGLRKGEALALTGRRSRSTSSRTRSTCELRSRKDATGALYLDEPKTKESNRTLHLPTPLAALLRAQRARQAAERLKFGEGWGGKWADRELVFTNSVGGPLDPDRVNRTVQKLARHAGAEYDSEGNIKPGTGLGKWTPHELRHSVASLLIAQGVPLKVVSETLGHDRFASYRRRQPRTPARRRPCWRCYCDGDGVVGFVVTGGLWGSDSRLDR